MAEDHSRGTNLPSIFSENVTTSSFSFRNSTSFKKLYPLSWYLDPRRAPLYD